MVEPDGAWAPMLLWRSATLMPLMPIKQSAVQTLAVKAAFSSVSTSPVATDRKQHGSHSVRLRSLAWIPFEILLEPRDGGVDVFFQLPVAARAHSPFPERSHTPVHDDGRAPVRALMLAFNIHDVVQ